MAGVDFNPLDLYPAVKMPVSRGTAMLSSLIRWDHEQLWDVPKGDQFITGPGGSGSSISFEIDASAESEDSYLVGHKIDGRVLYPATGYLVLVWRAFSKINRQSYEQFPVAFEDVHIHRATIMPKTGNQSFVPIFTINRYSCAVSVAAIDDHDSPYPMAGVS